MAELLHIESLDLDAQGVAHKEDGKVVFVEGALPFETVSANTYQKKDQWEKAVLQTLHKESSQRVRPGCAYFGLHKGACGGCKMQHLDATAQVAVKARALEDSLWHIGRVKAETLLRPMQGPTWGYRYRARISVRYVIKRETVLIGFHERKSRYVADMQTCAVLAPHVSSLLMPLRELIGSLHAREQVPQLEIACGDQVTAIVLRHLQPLDKHDTDKLRDFAKAHSDIGLEWWLQAKGPDAIIQLDPEQASQLAYALPEFGVQMPFRPTDFTQVNPFINQALVSRALRLLQVQPSERVIDWFCGLGNFTLPLATQAQAVLGVEGSETLVARAHANAALNGLAENTRFVARNLFSIDSQTLQADGAAEKWLIDPPREGAHALVLALAEAVQAFTESSAAQHETAEPDEAVQTPVAAWQPPQRIVYVSCNPATLARDAGILVTQAGYRCVSAGVINMFAHTAHVESIAVFERSV